jgi:hypothetical protein
MDPTIIDLLAAGNDDELRSKAQIMAQGLRGDRQLGMMGLGGGKLAAGPAKAMLADAAGGERDMLAAGIANRANNFKQQKLISDFERALAVQQARNEGAMGLAQLRALAAGNRPTKPLPGKEADTLQELNASLRSINEVSKQFKNKYAGQSIAGRGVNWVGQIFGSAASDAIQEQNNFWATFKMLVELPTRHKFFGSALTPTEARSWAEAQNLGPGTSPEIIQQKFEWMQNLAHKKLAERAGARKAEGVYSGEAIDAMTDELGGEGAAPAAGTRKFTRVNGKLVEVK